MNTITYCCITCGDLVTLENWQEVYLFDEIEDEDDKKWLSTYPDTAKRSNCEIIVCEECYDHYFHGLICSLCGNYTETGFCPGHSAEEEMELNDGICPICDEYVGLGADQIINERNGEEPTGTCCMLHSLLEWREYHEQTASDQST